MKAVVDWQVVTYSDPTDHTKERKYLQIWVSWYTKDKKPARNRKGGMIQIPLENCRTLKLWGRWDEVRDKKAAVEFANMYHLNITTRKEMALQYLVARDWLLEQGLI